MINWLTRKRNGPIGVDLGTRSVKLVQFNGDRTQLLEAARWDMPMDDEGQRSADDLQHVLADAIGQAREGRNFSGRDAVLCLGKRELFVQNIRVESGDQQSLERQIFQEAAARIPYPVAEAEIRYLNTIDVRQGDSTMREIILLACHKPVLQQSLAIIEKAGLRPVAVDIEPAAMLRSQVHQFRRDEDIQQRIMLVHVGFSKTAVVIAEGEDVLFIKYIPLGGREMDAAVATHLQMSAQDARTVRRHNGDRRADQQDPDVARSVAEAVRPVVNKLANELSMCIRYHSVTFRGKPLSKTLLTGGEASGELVERVGEYVGLTCEIGHPLRSYSTLVQTGRHCQWDVAAGLALREAN